MSDAEEERRVKKGRAGRGKGRRREDVKERSFRIRSGRMELASTGEEEGDGRKEE
jgi:hypothetical protein